MNHSKKSWKSTLENYVDQVHIERDQKIKEHIQLMEKSTGDAYIANQNKLTVMLNTPMISYFMTFEEWEKTLEMNVDEKLQYSSGPLLLPHPTHPVLRIQIDDPNAKGATRSTFYTNQYTNHFDLSNLFYDRRLLLHPFFSGGSEEQESLRNVRFRPLPETCKNSIAKYLEQVLDIQHKLPDRPSNNWAPLSDRVMQILRDKYIFVKSTELTYLDLLSLYNPISTHTILFHNDDQFNISNRCMDVFFDLLNDRDIRLTVRSHDFCYLNRLQKEYNRSSSYFMRSDVYHHYRTLTVPPNSEQPLPDKLQYLLHKKLPSKDKIFFPIFNQDLNVWDLIVVYVKLEKIVCFHTFSDTSQTLDFQIQCVHYILQHVRVQNSHLFTTEHRPCMCVSKNHQLLYPLHYQGLFVMLYADLLSDDLLEVIPTNSEEFPNSQEFIHYQIHLITAILTAIIPY